MFIGREKELKELKEHLAADKKAAVLIYGKRRIGKTALIEQAEKDFDGTIINHLFAKTSYVGNLSLLCRSAALALNLPSSTTFATIFDLFDFLKAQSQNILVVLDEYQYFKESLKQGEVDSYMQAVVDSLPKNIKIIFCGSYIATMKELLQETNPLFGRLTKVMHIEEFDYLDASRFCPELPEYEKIRFYTVFGGSPYVLTNLDYTKSVEDNIKNLLINQNSLLRTYIENIMLREIQKAYDVRILEALGNGKKRYREIQGLLGMQDSGLLDKQLKNLIAMETVIKTEPINKTGDKKKQFYEIKDNLMRFYFAYIFANDSLIIKFGENEFFSLFVAKSLRTFVSLRFEGMVIQYFMRQARAGKLKGILDFGSFWYDDASTGTNMQFDCVLKEPDGYDFFEVKFYDKPMKKAECLSEEKQMRQQIVLPCKKIGFVCSAGFTFKSDTYELISAKNMYSLSY